MLAEHVEPGTVSGFHPLQRGWGCCTHLGEKAGTEPLAQAYTIRRKRLGFSPVRLHSPSNRDLRFGIRQPLAHFLLV